MERDPIVIGVITDLAARDAAEWRFRTVDRDDIDTLPGTLGVRVQFDIPGMPELTIERVDDFHPDSLLERVPRLSGLMAARKVAGDLNEVLRLATEAGYDTKHLEALLKNDPAAADTPPEAKAPATSAPQPDPQPEPDAESASSLLDSILDGGPEQPAKRVADPLDRYVQEVVRSSSVDTTDERHQRAVLDRLLGQQLSEVLRDRSFRRAETAGLSLNRLIRSAETGADLTIAVLSVNEQEFRTELAASVDQPGRLDRAIQTQWGYGSDSSPLAALFVDLEFGAQSQELAAATGLAAVAKRAGCAAIAAADHSLTGVDNIADLVDSEAIEAAADTADLQPWRDFRASASGRNLGLCLLNSLLRLPYGTTGEQIDAFEFDENAEATDSESYAWRRPSLALAEVAARAFVSEGHAANLDRYGNLDDLPLHVHQIDGRTVSRSPVEVELPQSAALALCARGFMPLVGIHNRDAARFVTIQSFAGGKLF